MYIFDYAILYPKASLRQFDMSEVKMEMDNAFDVHTPLLGNMAVGVPAELKGLTKQFDKMVEQPVLGPNTKFPAG